MPLAQPWAQGHSWDPSTATHCPSLLPTDIKMGKKNNKKTRFRRNLPFPILEKSQLQASRQTF